MANDKMKLIPGKVYLRNTRTGRVYEFEKNLASMSNVERVTANKDGAIEVAKAVVEEPAPVKGVDKRIKDLEAREADLAAREADLARREEAMRLSQPRGTNGSVEQPAVDGETDKSTANKLAESQTPVDNAKTTTVPPKPGAKLAPPAPKK